jgi:hypothetical protein
LDGIIPTITSKINTVMKSLTAKIFFSPAIANRNNSGTKSALTYLKPTVNTTIPKIRHFGFQKDRIKTAGEKKA